MSSATQDNYHLPHQITEPVNTFALLSGHEGELSNRMLDGGRKMKIEILRTTFVELVSEP